MRCRSLLFILLLSSIACRTTAAPKAETKASKRGSSPRPAAICPLTGIRAPRGLDGGRPALAIKIDNAVAARPQGGLESADIVYEELAEGGLTRFMAIFHCANSSRVGPVRSARLVDSDILREYTPVLFGYSGGNKEVLQKIRVTEGIADLRETHNPKAYERVKGRPAPHDLFTSTDKLRARSQVMGGPKIGLLFLKAAPIPVGPVGPAPKPSPKTPSAPASGSPSPSPSPAPTGQAVTFSFAGSQSTRYAFEPATGSYLRFFAGKPFKLENGSQARVTNVVVLKVKVREGLITDSAGNRSPEIGVVGLGEATILHYGRAITGQWMRKSLSDDMRLVDSTRRDIALAPGTTWIHLLPADRPVTLE